MEKATMSRLLIETTVRQTLKGLQENPKRSVRNLIDMALQFSQGRFQSNFFATAHTMLKNENSAYYTLVQDAAAHIETEHLVRFGMNLGYNSCTWGARRIRANEQELGFNIPWTVIFSLDGTLGPDRLEQYHTVIAEGESLGIYSWMLFSRGIAPQELLSLPKRHPDSAFFLFCPSGTVDEAFVQAAEEVYNLMPVVHFDETADNACQLLRERKLPYSVWVPYAGEEAASILNGELFDTVQYLHPIFTALLPRQNCSSATHASVCQAVEKARNGQLYATVPWDMYTDTCRLDEIISDDSCWAFFDSHGNLCLPGIPHPEESAALFSHGLTAVLRQTYPKTSALRPC